MNFWISRTALTCLSLFFLYFGIEVLKAAYKLNEPFTFILTFFASNLIILISAVLGLGFVLAMIRRIRGQDRAEEMENDQDRVQGESND